MPNLTGSESCLLRLRLSRALQNAHVSIAVASNSPKRICDVVKRESGTEQHLAL